MTRVSRSGATAAAVLPAALAGALLVSAPFAGTTTAPLASSRSQAATTTTTSHSSASGHGQDNGLRLDISPSSVAMLGGAELLLLCVGGGVIVAARRRRFADD